MSMTSDGLVIRETKVGEYDRAVTVLTRDYGIVHAFAVGARKVKSKKNASTSLLAFSSFSFSEGKTGLRVEDASPKEMFFSLRSSIELLSVAQYLCEIAGVLSPQDAPAEEYLRVMLNGLYFLGQPDSDPLLIKSIVELRLASLAGYQPNLVACRECGAFEADWMIFSVPNADIVCQKCGMEQESAGLKIDKSVLSAMRQIVYAPLDRLFRFSLSHDKVKALSSLTEAYVIDKTERTYKTLPFLHSLGL